MKQTSREKNSSMGGAIGRHILDNETKENAEAIFNLSEECLTMSTRSSRLLQRRTVNPMSFGGV